MLYTLYTASIRSEECKNTIVAVSDLYECYSFWGLVMGTGSGHVTESSYPVTKPRI